MEGILAAAGQVITNDLDDYVDEALKKIERNYMWRVGILGKRT